MEINLEAAIKECDSLSGASFFVALIEANGIWDSDGVEWLRAILPMASANILISGFGRRRDTNKSQEFQASFHSPRRYQINPPFCISLFPSLLNGLQIISFLSTSRETFSFFPFQTQNEERIFIFWFMLWVEGTWRKFAKLKWTLQFGYLTRCRRFMEWYLFVSDVKRILILQICELFKHSQTIYFIIVINF